MHKDNNIIVGLDIGTTKVSAVIAEFDDEEINVKGVGTSPSKGLQRGMVNNLEWTVQSINQAVRKAEMMAGIEVERVYAGVTGSHIRSINSRGVIATRGGNVITAEDVRRVISQAKAVAVPMDREILHVIPQEFVVDDQAGVRDPIGLFGIRLEADVHVITGSVTASQNLIRSIERANCEVTDLVLEPLASSHSVLSPDEQELGVALVDIGGGTTDIAIFHNGGIRYTTTIPLGGNNITSDIAIVLRTPLEKAEMLKEKYGSLFLSETSDDEMVTVPSISSYKAKEVPRQLLVSIIQPRVEEILGFASKEIRKTEFADLIAAGVVLTGGVANLSGIDELAEQIFDVPVRIGYPQGVGGLRDAVRDPKFATGVGLVLYGYRHRGEVDKKKSHVWVTKVVDHLKVLYQEAVASW